MAKKTKLGMGIASSALALSLIAGGTYALFSANAVNADNQFTAGTIKLQDFTNGKVASRMVNFSNLAPGDKDTKKITIKNTGSLDAWVRINDQATQASRTGDLFNGSKPLQISYSKDPVRVDAGQTVELDVSYLFPIDADDSYQNASGSINIVVDAVQVRNNLKGDGTPNWFPSAQTFITPSDFYKNGWDIGGHYDNGFGYSTGFTLAESPAKAGVNQIKVAFYKDNTLLQENVSESALLALDTTSFSTTSQSIIRTNGKYDDEYWTYGAWNGSTTDVPTKVVITVTTNDGHTYTATNTAK